MAHKKSAHKMEERREAKAHAKEGVAMQKLEKAHKKESKAMKHGRGCR